MKRKLALALIAMASSMMTTAYADGFGTLVFKFVSGESYSVNTQGLEIYYNDGKLTFNNDESVLPVSSLVSMEFSDNSGSGSGKGEILTDSTDSVTVLSIDGINIGEFPSLADACRNLEQGLYVVCRSNGETFKIKVEQ